LRNTPADVKRLEWKLSLSLAERGNYTDGQKKFIRTLAKVKKSMPRMHGMG
jgi:hypothetical protein